MDANRNASQIVEAYKTIRSNILENLGDRNGCRIITVTSPTQSEGKTTSAINIAVALSQTGKRVLLIDSDMRNGSVHKKLRLSSTYGLYDLLKNRAVLDDAIISAGSLDVIVSGGQVSDPSDLLFSDTFENLISGLRFAYDFIVIDTASVCDFKDALYVSKLSDGAVLIVREGKSTYRKIDAAIKLLSDYGIFILGSVINASAE